MSTADIKTAPYGARRGARVGAVVVAGGLLALAGGTSASAAPLPSNCTASGTTVTCIYNYTGGEQTFVAPAGVTSAVVTANGAPGGAQSFGGDPALVAATTALT